jgi:hypothetical protein
MAVLRHALQLKNLGGKCGRRSLDWRTAPTARHARVLAAKRRDQAHVSIWPRQAPRRYARSTLLLIVCANARRPRAGSLSLRFAAVRPIRRFRCCFGCGPFARGIRSGSVPRSRSRLASHVDYDPSLVRSSEIMYSLGDPTKAAQVLEWHSTVKMPEIVTRMVRAEQETAGAGVVQ